MKKFTLTTVSTAICTLSIATIFAAPSFAQQPTTTTPPANKTAPAATPTGTNAQPSGTNAQPSSTNAQQAIEQLKLTKDQQIKLAKLKQSVIKKNIAVLTPSQKEQLRLATEQGKAPTLTLTVEQQTQLKAIQTAAIAEQNKILTPEQQSKLQEINKQITAPQK
jgi:Spy/CpxP family protein refolding chaperone